MSRTIAPQVDYYTVPVRAAAPQAIGIARALARMFTRTALRGSGAVRYGAPAIGTRAKFSGYGNTPQLFLGYSPTKVAAGTFRGAPSGLPSTSAPLGPANSATLRAMATVTQQQMTNG